MDKGAVEQLLAHEDSPLSTAPSTSTTATQSVRVTGDEDSRAVGRKGTITLQMLREHFHLPLHTVAKKFGMCTTAFKKMCRRMEIPKWPHRQLRGIDKKIAALKTELNYATNADRQQFIAGLTSLETEKTRLSQGIFTNLSEEANESGSDSRSRSPNTDAEADTTPPPAAPESAAAADGDADTDSDGTIDDDPARPNDGDLQQISSVVVTERELRDHFHLPLHTVAKKFGMCTTAFKKLCRRFAIAKWPHRQLRGIDKKIAALRAALNYSTGDKDACWANLKKLEEEKARIARTGPDDDAESLASPAGSGQAVGGIAGGPVKGSPKNQAQDARAGGAEARASSRADISNLLCDEEEEEEDEEVEVETTAEGGDGEGKGGEESAWSGGAITEDVLREHFHLPLQVVAKKFGMCTTAFKKLCRRFAIAKWPHRQLRGIDKKIAALRAALNYSTGDRHTCQRSIVALEEEKARLTQAALGDKSAPAASSPRAPPAVAASLAPSLALSDRIPRSPAGGSTPRKRKGEEWGGKTGDKRRREEGEGKRSKEEDEVPARPGLAGIDMLVSAASHGMMQEELVRDRAEGWGHASAGMAPPHPPASAPLSAEAAGALSRALSFRTPFNTPPLDPASPLLPVPVPAGIQVPPMSSAPGAASRPALVSPWGAAAGGGLGGRGGALAVSAGMLVGGSLGLPQPSWGVAAPGSGRMS